MAQSRLTVGRSLFFGFWVFDAAFHWRESFGIVIEVSFSQKPKPSERNSTRLSPPISPPPLQSNPIQSDPIRSCAGSHLTWEPGSWNPTGEFKRTLFLIFFFLFNFFYFFGHFQKIARTHSCSSEVHSKTEIGVQGGLGVSDPRWSDQARILMATTCGKSEIYQKSQQLAYIWVEVIFG